MLQKLFFGRYGNADFLFLFLDWKWLAIKIKNPLHSWIGLGVESFIIEGLLDNTFYFASGIVEVKLTARAWIGYYGIFSGWGYCFRWNFLSS